MEFIHALNVADDFFRAKEKTPAAENIAPQSPPAFDKKPKLPEARPQI